MWLERRLKRCQIPAKGDEVTAELQWQAAPCLYEMYRERLAALGAPQPAPPPPQVAEDRSMHPVCLVLAESERPIPLKACNQATGTFR